MRISLAVACLLVACISITLAAPGDVAPVGTSAAVLIRPDLIVKQVVVSRGGAVEFPTYTFKITVANIGTANAGASRTGVLYYALYNTTQPMAAGFLGDVATPAIPAGGETVVSVSSDRLAATTYLFVGADFPETGKLVGNVTEKSETNNAMTVPFVSSATFPKTFK